MSKVHVLIGSADDYGIFQEATENGESTPWVVPKTALPGDMAVIFFPSVGQIIGGIGELADEPEAERPGRYLSALESLELLDPPTQLAQVATRFPDWEWPKYPRSHTTAPDDVGERLLDLVRSAVEGSAENDIEVEPFDPSNEADGRRRIEATIVARQGQGRFRQQLLEAYGHRCAVSGCGVLDVLDAAHILPYRGDDTNHVQNGLLLRTDLHTLFDRHLLSIDPKSMTVVIAPTIEDRCFKVFQGKTLRLPDDPKQQPNKTALKKHFKAWGLDQN